MVGATTRTRGGSDGEREWCYDGGRPRLGAIRAVGMWKILKPSRSGWATMRSSAERFQPNRSKASFWCAETKQTKTREILQRCVEFEIVVIDNDSIRR